jgi:hypothetical protein
VKIQWQQGAEWAAPSQAERVHADTGLSAGQQEARALAARQWATRVLWLQQVSGADVRLALKAVEAADRSNDE